MNQASVTPVVIIASSGGLYPDAEKEAGTSIICAEIGGVTRQHPLSAKKPDPRSPAPGSRPTMDAAFDARSILPPPDDITSDQFAAFLEAQP
jgi:hypothetical protein